MDKIELYTKDEIDILTNYYNEKVIGKTFGLSRAFKIDEYLIEKYGTKYGLTYIGYYLNQSNFRLKRDVSTLYKEIFSLSPLEVLKGQHLSQ